jgi:hypothetical protein
MADVFPRTRLIFLVGVLALLGACGQPPQPLPTSPPYSPPSDAPISLGASIPGLPTLPPTGPVLPTAGGPVLPTLPGYPTAYPTLPGYGTPPPHPPPTTPPTTRAPTPAPSHAGNCTTEPTKAQILTLIKGNPGLPPDPLRVVNGPYCSGDWSFTTVQVTGKTADPLMVVTTGKGTTLALVAAGSDVCLKRVQTEAPPGIRVLACGF